MDPLTMGLITGGANLLGSMFSSATSASNTDAQIAGQRQMQAESEQFNAQQAQINRDYQTQMSNTAYQRASQDMSKAGLNPMMMFGSGSAASSPGGAAASIGTPTMPKMDKPSMFAGVGDAVNKVVSSAVQGKTFEKMSEEIANLRTQEALTAATTKVRGQELATEVEETKRRGALADTATLAIPAARFSAKSSEDLLAMPEWLRTAANVGSFVGRKADDVISPVMSSAKGVQRLLQYPDNPTKKYENGGPSFRQRWKDANEPYADN